jgi:hypothetical protein
MDPYYYILDGKEPRPAPDPMDWGRWFGNFDNRRVAQTEAEGITVSTVFLGLNHQHGDGPPLLYETMIFAPGLPDLDEWCERWTTWDEAEAGHAQAVALVNEALNPPAPPHVAPEGAERPNAGRSEGG